MKVNTRNTFLYILMSFTTIVATMSGCTGVTRLNNADGTSLFSFVEQNEYGEYELSARRLEADPYMWTFSVESRRTTVKNQFTFIWDFGDGVLTSGTEQTYSYPDPGTYMIKVTAVDSRENIVFVLILTIDVETDANHVPEADAGPDQTVPENSLVFLYAGNSTDPDSDPLEYKWLQISGTPIQIMNAAEPTARFIAPFVDANTEFEFAVLVSDGTFSSQDTSKVFVQDVVDTGQQQLIAEAGLDQEATTGQTVTFDGSNSINDTGEVASYFWKQISGTAVTLLNANQDVSSFEAPAIATDSEILTFSLSLSAGDLTSTDFVDVTVSSKDSGGLPGECYTSSTLWKNIPFASQSGIFTAEFDVTPIGSTLDAIVALSKGSGNTFSDFGTLIRFNASGFIDVRDGGVYRSDAAVAYLNNVVFHFRMQVDIPSHTYSVYVTPDGDNSEIALANQYSFRLDQNAVTDLDNLGVWSDMGSFQICDFTLGSGGPLTTSAGNDKTIVTGESTVLDGTAGGGSGIYVYSWSPSTGLISTSVSRPAASPDATTTYTLTVIDSDNTYGTDTVTVFVTSAPLITNAGPDLAFVEGGSVVLQGSASGGAAPYSYSWSPSTGLSNANIAQPTASLSQSTSYTLTVTDNDGNTNNDSVSVNLVSGSIYYVDKNNPAADDGNPGTENSPFKTIAAAANVVQSGEIVMIKAGTYNETLRPMNSGLPGANIVYKAYPSDACQGSFADIKSDCKVILDGQNILKNGVSLSKPVTYVRIEGFEIRNHIEDGVFFQSWYDRGVEGIEIVNNYIHHNAGEGIYARNSINTLIESNEIFANGSTAISFGGQYAGLKLTISGNNIHYNGRDGMQGGGTDLIIEFNVMYDQFHTSLHQDGFQLTNIRNVIIRYNTIYDFTQLIYLALNNNPGGFIEDIEIYGNVLYTDRYWTVTGGEAPGIFIDARENDVIVRNINIHSNTFGWLGYAAIRVYDGGISDVSNITIYNNIFTDSGIDIGIQNTTTINSDYNLYYSTPGNSHSVTPWLNEGIHSQEFTDKNPPFVNYVRHLNYDFHLSPEVTNPAIDTGDSSLGALFTLPGNFVDIDGNSRPFDSTKHTPDGINMYDIGAYEYHE